MKEKASVAWSLSMPRGGPLAHQEHETLASTPTHAITWCRLRKVSAQGGYRAERPTQGACWLGSEEARTVSLRNLPCWRLGAQRMGTFPVQTGWHFRIVYPTASFYCKWIISEDALFNKQFNERHNKKQLQTRLKSQFWFLRPLKIWM